MISVRTFYFKVADVSKAVAFWEHLLLVKAHKDTSSYGEFKIGDMRFGFVLNNFGDVYEGNRGVVMFNFDSDTERDDFVLRAQNLGAKTLSDNRLDSVLRSISLEDSLGNEFEVGSLNHD